ncbi:MAG: hypothetical protein MUC56_02460 [Thermoanaerobaculales bacterium]|jgi:hypothetical protein|nr:hypothetical protein [Thermoanaerobaculales bacterium]
MDNVLTCGGCGADLPQRSTICPLCGWDLSAAISSPPRASLLERLASGGWRLLVYGGVIALVVLGFIRLRDTGPGPDLATTLRWMVFGDDGRAAELVTIHRMHEIGAAASRHAVREVEAFPFGDGWAEALAPKSTMNVRGWLPLVFFGADAGMAPASVRVFYEVRDSDGWDRPYRVATRVIERGEGWRTDPEVAADLEAGLQAHFHTVDRPDLGTGDWLRLELVSAGRDGAFDTADDLRFISYSLISAPLRMMADPDIVVRRIERAYTVGEQFFRVEGSRWDLVDARLLAEFRLTSVT